MTIHGEHPFMPPESERSPVRRFRGRMPSPVSVWTTTTGERRAGLTVSSLMVANGEPGYILGLIDPDSDLWDLLPKARKAVVNLLAEPHRQLADAFGYVAPAPGGPFRLAEWHDTSWGPALADATAWAGCVLADAEPDEVGWSLLVRLQIEDVTLGPEGPGLVHRRGRYLGV